MNSSAADPVVIREHSGVIWRSKAIMWTASPMNESRFT